MSNLWAAPRRLRIGLSATAERQLQLGAGPLAEAGVGRRDGGGLGAALENAADLRIPAPVALGPAASRRRLAEVAGEGAADARAARPRRRPAKVAAPGSPMLDVAGKGAGGARSLRASETEAATEEPRQGGGVLAGTPGSRRRAVGGQPGSDAGLGLFRRRRRLSRSGGARGRAGGSRVRRGRRGRARPLFEGALGRGADLAVDGFAVGGLCRRDAKRKGPRRGRRRRRVALGGRGARHHS